MDLALFCSYGNWMQMRIKSQDLKLKDREIESEKQP